MQALRKWKGDGEVFDGEKLLGKFAYDLTEYGEPGGISKIKGAVEPFFVSAPHPPEGKIFKLYLEDGHKLEFFYRSRSSWTISPAGVADRKDKRVNVASFHKLFIIK